MKVTDIYLVVFVVFGLWLIYDLLKISHKKNSESFIKISSFPSKVNKKAKRKLGRSFGIMRRRLDNLNMRDRKKSYVYKYFSQMSSVLSSLELQDITNPETVFILISLGSVIVGTLFSAGLGLWITLFTISLCVIISHAALLFVSHTATIERVHATMDAEDLLASNMEDGVLESVQKSLGSIDKRVRPVFEDFYNDIMGIGMPMEKAIIRMNMRLGKSMDSFCENALVHYRDNDDTTLKYFKDGIVRNTKRRILLQKQQVQYTQSMTLYLIGMGLCMFIGLISSAILGSGLDYYLTVHGRITLIASLGIIIGGFVSSQVIYSGGVD